MITWLRQLGKPFQTVSAAANNARHRAKALMEVVRHGRVDLTPLITHTYPLEKIPEAYKLFGDRADGVLKIAIKP